MGKKNERYLWHKKVGHIKFDNLVKINKTEVTIDNKYKKTR